MTAYVTGARERGEDPVGSRYAYPLLGQSPEKNRVFAVSVLKSKFVGASNHHEMARYDLPTYVLYASRHFWMFAVKITECVFSLKSLGLLTPTYP